MLGLHARPDAVVRPLDVLVHLRDQAETPLPPDIRISDVFDDAAGTLLILGAPGAGKTTLLLELTRDLLDRAEQDMTHPIPVIFPLSSWAERQLPLQAWLVDELNKRYDVSCSLAQTWIATEAVLPLLDGLDEVAPAHRSACVEAINIYRQARGLLPIVVSCRSDNYDELRVKLRLHGAIVVQPLTREQVPGYLRAIGLRVTPSSTSLLWDLLDTPLMLNVVALTYAGRTETLPLLKGTPAEQRQHLFTAYVTHMPQDHTLAWLAWLAWQMQYRDQPVLYLEHLQPEWLPTRSARWVYTFLDRMGNGLGVGFVIVLVVGLVGALSSGGRDLHEGLRSGVLFGLIGGLLTALFGGVVGVPSPMQQRIAQQIWSPLAGGLVVGFVSGLAGGLFYGPDYGLNVWMFGGLFGSLAGVLVGSPHIRPRHVKAVEALRWLWHQAWCLMLLSTLFGPANV